MRSQKGVFLAAGIIVVLLVTMAFYSFVIMNGSDDISIDGNFSDWDDVPTYADEEDQENKGIDIVRCAVDNGDEYLYFYVETADEMYQGIGSSGDSIRLFLDTDVSIDTGYVIEGIGADYLIEIYGIHNEIFSSNYYEYYVDHRSNSEEPRGQYDWNAWAPMFKVDSRVEGNKLEASLWVDELRIPSTIKPRVLVQAVDPLGNYDFSPVFSRAGSVGAEVSGYGREFLSQGTSVEFLSLVMENNGRDSVTISGLTFLQSSTATRTDLDSAELYLDGEPVAEGIFDGNTLVFSGLDLKVKSQLDLDLVLKIASDSTTGHGLVLTLSDVNSKAGVSYTGDGVAAYIASSPSIPVVDGLFEDWTNPVSDDTGEVDNPNVDISAYDSRNYDLSTYYYMKVEGNMLHGRAVPVDRALNVPHEDDNQQSGNQDDSPLPVETGEDAVYVFLDTVPGLGYTHINIPFGADYMIKITGQNGFIHSSEYYRFDGKLQNEWSWEFVKHVEADSNTKEIETSVNEQPLNSYFHMVDWSEENEDYSSHAIGVDGLKPGGSRDIVIGGSSNEKFGSAVAVADFNDDGDMDVAIGAPAWNSERGRVYIFYGDGTDTGIDPDNPDVVISGKTTTQDDKELGAALAVGDFDNDGDTDDLAVGAPTWDTDDSGRVFIFLNGGSDLDDEDDADITLDGDVSGGQNFGSSIIAGNFNGRGYDDLAVGAPFYGSDDYGRVYVYYDPSPSDENDDFIANGSSTNQYLGSALAKGDFDNHGDVDDIVIGSPFTSTSSNGKISIHEDTANSHVTTISSAGGYTQLFGSAVGVGDFDNGGYKDDLLVGAPTYRGWGGVYLYYDGSGTPTLFDEGSSGEQFGSAIAVADFNGDGKDDIVIGAPGWRSQDGRWFIYYGGDSPITGSDVTKLGSSDQNLGSAFATGMIVDNAWNGADLVVGAPADATNDGKAIIYENVEDLGIPEFHTIILPVSGIIGLLVVFRRRRK